MAAHSSALPITPARRSCAPSELSTSDLGPEVGGRFRSEFAGGVEHPLVRRNPDTRVLSVHRLVQAVLKDGMEVWLQRQWAEYAVRAVNHVFPQPQTNAQPQISGIRTNGVRITYQSSRIPSWMMRGS